MPSANAACLIRGTLTVMAVLGGALGADVARCPTHCHCTTETSRHPADVPGGYWLCQRGEPHHFTCSEGVFHHPTQICQASTSSSGPPELCPLPPRACWRNRRAVEGSGDGCLERSEGSGCESFTPVFNP